MIRSNSLGMVSYKGDGKYDHSTFWHWHQVPDSEDNDPDYGDENLLWPPDGQGWWPVIAITLDPSCGVVPGGEALIICFWQLGADELIVTQLSGTSEGVKTCACSSLSGVYSWLQLLFDRVYGPPGLRLPPEALAPLLFGTRKVR